MSGLIATKTFTIANAGNLSAAVYVGNTPVRITMPAAWTTANLTFQVSQDGTTFYNKYDQHNTEFEVKAAASRSIDLDPGGWLAAPYLKIRSGTSGTPVAQDAERLITLQTREV